MKRILLIWLSFAGCCIYAQDTTKVVYNYNYRFNDGIYLSFEQFKSNMPVSPEAIEFENNEGKYSDVFEFIDNSKTIKYYNEYGIITEIEKNQIWGYCKNGKPHIFWGNDFRIIPFIGSICHFIANITVYYDSNQSMFYDPYSRYSAAPDHYYTTEVVQMMINMNNGDIISFDEINVGLLLQADSILSEEFNALGKRKKRQMLFYYIRKFNENNPLYLPSQ
jgi:hypothetical protein